jgi:hypothetical protein
LGIQCKQWFEASEISTVVTQFTSLICSSKTARKAKSHKKKINFQEEASGTTIGLQEEGALISENRLVN